MKFSKRLISFSLAAIMALSMAACDKGGTTVTPDDGVVDEIDDKDETPDETEDEGTDETSPYRDTTGMTQAEILELVADFPAPSGSVTKGASTQMNANLFWGWDNITINAEIKGLLFNYYELVTMTPYEEFIVNPIVVKDFKSTDNEDGSKTYTFEIYDNLVYNDGSKITAKDYAFYIMLRSSPEFVAIDGAATVGLNLVGYESFNKGYLINADGEPVDADGNVVDESEKVLTKKFEGVNVVDDYTLSLTIKAEKLPFFYELSYFYNDFPVPMSVLAPNVEITDDGTGATFSEEFTADLIRETINTPGTGYRFNPTVTSGPYQLESYDNTTFTCVLKANPNFLATYDGYKPRIEKLIFKTSSQSTEMNELEAGTLDIITGVSTGTTIDAGLDLADKGIVSYQTYPRNGYGKIAFHCDFGPTQFEAVRQAICYLLDRDDFGRQYSGGYAIVVDGRYSESQWTYQEAKDILSEKLISYTLNPDKAREILIADGWVLDENGNDYVEAPGKVRYKEVDGELMPLVIQWCSSKDNVVSDLLAIMLPPAAEQVGMKIEQTIQDSVLDSYYRAGVDEPFYHMFNMGTGFAKPDAPWTNYSTDPVYLNASYNSNYIINKDLERLTESMKLTDPSDREGFLNKWIEYQVAWNKALPDIPLYANIYHDFYAPKIKDFYPTPVWSYDLSIVRAYVD